MTHGIGKGLADPDETLAGDVRNRTARNSNQTSRKDLDHVDYKTS